MKFGHRYSNARELVFTSFSGSHQDAISKDLKDFIVVFIDFY